MTERALTGFVKVVELGSFTAAADALFISQSALSQQIRTLENQLHFTLFQHGSRQVTLTAAGRSFYPKAKQILRLYESAVKEGIAIEQNTRPPHRHLFLACQDTALSTFCYELFAMTPELCVEFSPLVQYCANRADVWRALDSGEADLSFQMECAGIAARGLQFTPILSLPELCFPFNVPDSLPQRILSLDEALACRWIFAFPSSETLYETEIAHQARKKGGFVIQPGTVESAAYGLPTLMLTPCIYHRRPSFDWVRMLRWGEGNRFGVVTAAAPDETVLRYIEEIRTVIRVRQHQLFGILN